MDNHNIYEHKRLFVRFSDKILNKIDDIYDYNSDNIDGVRLFFEYIEDVKKFISDSSIAFDYDGKHLLRNGTIYRNDLDYNVGFSPKVSKKGVSYLYVYTINLKTDEFGLKNPPLKSNESFEYISLRDYITELKYINTTYKMKSLLLFIQESKGASLGQRTDDRFEKDILLKNKHDRKYKALELKYDKAKKLFKELSNKLGIELEYTPEDTEDNFCVATFKKELPRPILNAIDNGETDYLMLRRDKGGNRVISAYLYELRPLLDLLKRI